MLRLLLTVTGLVTVVFFQALQETAQGRSGVTVASDDTRLNLAGVLQLARMKKTLFVDARASAAFQRGSIKNARSVPAMSDLSADAPVIAELREAEAIIIFCESGGCNQSTRLKEKLLKFGLPNLYVYDGGFGEWLAAGLSTTIP